MNYPRVSILVLNWNGWQAAIRCLESLYRITYPNYDVILIDNHSQNDSVAKIKEWAEGEIPVEDKFVKCNPEGKPIRYIEYQRREAEAGGGREKEISDLPSDKKLTLIKNEQNYGGITGCNIGIRYALRVLNSEYVLFLHNDTIVSPGFLDELINMANREPGAGILGAKLFYYNEPDRIWWAGGVLNYWTGTITHRGAGERLFDLGQTGDTVEVDWVATCGGLFPREVWQTVGLLDEALAWGEDVDLCIRAAGQGFKLLFVPKSEIWHDSERKPSFLAYYFPKSRLILMQKHWSNLQLVSAILFVMVGLVKYLLHCLLRCRDWKYLKLYVQGHLDYFKERKSYRQKAKL